MRKIYKVLLAILVVSISFTASAQQDYWASRTAGSVAITDKAVARQSFPKEFKLFQLNIEPLRQQLFTVVDNRISHKTIISLPNADGNIEQFEVVEASNFDPALQARFPEIRAFSGLSVTDKGAMLKLSISPQGIQTMVFRNNGQPNEYIEPYSQDRTVYAVFRSQRNKGALPWVCSTPDQQLAANINAAVYTNRTESNAGQLKTMRLAQSCNAEYSNWFGAFNSSQVALVLAAFNATLTRCNGCYEKDLAIHLNLIPNTDLVIFYDPATDPYTTMANWNNQLQATLTAIIGEANYDIGHMFGASGGGGNAGCIGCVCVDGQKGRGITSPADGIPQGDNFDIDYVAHEVGHQMGGNHTFSFALEGTGVNKEVGAGITIMGYAGITNQDPAPHSIDIFHQASIQQIQVNMATKTCPITTNLAGVNATPVVNPQGPYTIPISTPFALTGSASDADPGDVLTYCYEQDDNSTTTGNNSVAFPTKLTGPNWLTFPATTSPTKNFPILATILAGGQTTGPLPGGDPICTIEALSSVSRVLNFRLTVRDNRPYSSTPPLQVGQTNFTDVVVTVTNTSGPFAVTVPNGGESYPAGSTQTVTWNVNNTNLAPVSAANVKISLSTDGGLTFPTVLIASTPNDGSEAVTFPGSTTSTARLKIEAVGNIFFDISNANFTLSVPTNGFTFNNPAPVTATCPAPNVMTSGNLTATYIGAFTGNINLTASVNPAGPTVSFSNNPLTTGSPSTTVSLTGMAGLSPGNYTVTVTGTGTTAPFPVQNRDIVFTINPGVGPAINTQPSNQTICSGSNTSYTVNATGATAYQWQLSTTGCGGTWSNISNTGIYSGATTATLTLTGATTAQNGYAYRVIVTGQCGTTTSSCATLTVNTAPAITSHPSNIAVCSGSAASFTVAATGSNLTYQWEISVDGGATWAPIAGATSSTYTIAATTVAMNGNRFRAVVSGSCPPSATSNAAILTVNSSVTVTGNPANSTICEGTGTSFSASASGTGLNYQWEVSTNGGATWSNVVNGPNYSGATTPTLTLVNTPPSFNGNRYRANITSPPCTPGITSSALLTVNTFPVITAQPTDFTMCEGGNPSFSVSATTAVGSLTYQWQISTNGGSTWSNITGATSNTYAQTNIPVGANGYKFRVIVTAGCGSSTSNVATLNINAYPVFDLIGLPKEICKSDPSFTLTASVSGGVWTGTGVTAGNVFSPVVSGVGVRTVTYTVTNAGCVTAKSSAVTVDECPDRHLLLSQHEAVKVAPNPNTGSFNLIMKSDLYSKLSVKVYGADGKYYKTLEFSGLVYGSVMPVNLTGLGAGTYYLHMYNEENGLVTRRDGVVILKP